jgi:Ca2+-binding RTX toxin-like protein
VLLLALLAVPSTAGAARAKHGVKAQVKHRTLTIAGNRKANSVTLRKKGGRLLVDVKSNGSADFKFKLKSFRRIVVTGGRGKDTVRFTGTRAADTIRVSRKGRTVRITGGLAKASAAAVRKPSLSVKGVETIGVTPGAGADSVAIGDLARTGVRAVAVGLGSSRAGDGSPDAVTAAGSAGDDTVAVAGGPSAISVTGLRVPLRIANVEPADRIAVNGAGGADTLHLTGTPGADTIRALAFGPLLHGVLDGLVVESDDIETVRLDPMAGQDTLDVQNMAGTDVSQVAADLGVTPGGLPDGQVDSLTINGSDGADTAAVSGGPSGVIVSGLGAGNSMLAPDPVDRLTVDGLGGADSLNASGFTPGTSILTLRGGPDNDAITGSPGDDTFAWDPGDGVDTVEGGAGSDTTTVGGSDGNESFTVLPNGGRVSIQGPGGVVVDMDDVETANFVPRGGIDVVAAPNALPGTDLTTVSGDLGADGQVDDVRANGTNAADNFHVGPSGSGAAVTGSGLKVIATSGEADVDTLTVSGLADLDVIDASALPAGVIGISHAGGLGNDTFIGSPGRDLFNGGDGDDVALMGAGDDVFTWNPGDDNDILEGQAGTDRLLFNGANISEKIDISPNGGRMRFTRDVASVTMDSNDVERVDFMALGGADLVTLNDMSGTDLTQVNLNLATFTGTGDGAVDSVVLHGTSSGDNIALGGGPSPVTATGLLTTLSVAGGEATDNLSVLAGAGNDSINAEGVAAGSPKLTLQGEDNDDTIRGSFQPDNLDGGAGTDTVFFTPGDTITNAEVGFPQ